MDAQETIANWSPTTQQATLAYLFGYLQALRQNGHDAADRAYRHALEYGEARELIKGDRA